MHTNVTELVTNYWEIRHLPNELLAFKPEVLIYDYVYALYHYKEKSDIFGIEIHNKELADMQKKLFDIVWNQAQKMKITSPHGAAKLV